MKTSEEMIAFFRSMPSKKRDNPYWEFVENPLSIRSKHETLFDLKTAKQVLISVREFFRRYHESFRSEAQVLCVTPEDAKKLNMAGIPILTSGMLGPFKISVMVLPQDNSGGTSRISEWLWQNIIIKEGIQPVARIHSHHILSPYQSSIDYSTLNSGTMEMVIGHIYEESLYICYWLDVPGTDIKAQTFVAQEADGVFNVVPYKFNGPDINDLYAKRL